MECILPSKIWIFEGCEKLKRWSLLGNTETDFLEDSPIIELDRWNFQQMLDLVFPEVWAHLNIFLFSSFHRGWPKEKIEKTFESPQKSGSSFPNRDPLCQMNGL